MPANPSPCSCVPQLKGEAQRLDNWDNLYLEYQVGRDWAGRASCVAHLLML